MDRLVIQPFDTDGVIIAGAVFALPLLEWAVYPPQPDYTATLSFLFTATLLKYLLLFTCVFVFHGINLRIFPSTAMTRWCGWFLLHFGVGVYRLFPMLTHLHPCNPLSFPSLLYLVFLPRFTTVVLVGVATIAPIPLAGVMVGQAYPKGAPFLRFAASVLLSQVSVWLGSLVAFKAALVIMQETDLPAVNVSAVWVIILSVLTVALFALVIYAFAQLVVYVRESSSLFLIDWFNPKNMKIKLMSTNAPLLTVLKKLQQDFVTKARRVGEAPADAPISVQELLVMGLKSLKAVLTIVDVVSNPETTKSLTVFNVESSLRVSVCLFVFRGVLCARRLRVVVLYQPPVPACARFRSGTPSMPFLP